MMKKKLMIAVLALSVFAVAACGRSQSEESTAASEAQTEAQSDAAAEESEEGFYEVPTDAEGNPLEELYFDGTVQAMTSSQLTVVSDDGETALFDISNAQRGDNGDELLQTAYVEVGYTGELSPTTPAAATYVAVMMSNEQQADALGVDPVIYGTVQFVDQNDLILNDVNGVEHTLDNSISHTVSFSQVEVGSEVCVTYIGTIDKEAQKDDEDGSGAGTPIVLKIVTSDAFNSEKAAENYITGVVNEVGDGTMLVDTSAASFEFTGDPSLFAGIESDDDVNVYYSGAIGNRSVEATRVEKL